MSNIGMVEAKLPPGFRFHPKDDELVCDYLMRKAAAAVHPASDSVLMIEVDLNKCEPWDIPDFSHLSSLTGGLFTLIEIACVGSKEWYFYSQRDRKYATGLRTNRATASGYWKATGKDRTILRKGVVVGMRKTLVFYQGRAPKGRKTDWVMHEFRIEGPQGPPKISSHKEDWVLCRVFFKNREVVASRPSYFGLDRGADSSLPPLMDSYITFDPTTQQHGSTQFDDEQVPCFSNIFSQPSSTIFPHCGFLNTKISSTDLDAVAAGSYGSSSSDLGSCFDSISYINYNPSGSEKKVLKDVLNQLTGNSNRNGGAKEKEGSSDSCFSLSHGGSVWGHY